MLEMVYRNAVHSLRLKISVFRSFITAYEQKINLFEGRIDYYEMRLQGMKDESKASQFKKVIG